MHLTTDCLTVWELAHRLANKRPSLLSSAFIPSDVKDNLRLLLNEIYEGKLESATLSMEKWDPDSDSDPKFYIRYHLDDIFNCISGKSYKRSLMKLASIDKIYFEDWCIKSSYPLPDFWFSIDYQYDELDMEPLSPDINSAQFNGHQGGKKRASKFESLKLKVYDLYDSKYTHLDNNSEIARRILRELSSEDLKVLTTGTPEKTIAIWIGEYKKSKK